MPSTAAIRAARRMRSGSSANERSPTARRTPRVDVGGAAAGVDRARRPRAARAIALTVKSRTSQVGLDRLAAQRRHVDVPGVRRAAAPARSRTRSDSSNGWPPRAAGDARAASSVAPSTARSTSVDLASAQRVADRPADDPCPLAPAEGLARRPHRRGARRALGRAPPAPSSYVGPRHPRRDPAGDLVVDRVEAPRHAPRRGCARRPGRRSATAVGAGLDLRLRAEVDGHVVHRHRADERVSARRRPAPPRCWSAPGARRRRSRSAARPTQVSRGARQRCP